jgi:FeS assembly SUF system protein
MAEGEGARGSGDAGSPAEGGAPGTRDLVIEALRTCFDPEIPVNIYDLGLIYEVKVDGSRAYVKMTLTSPACPVAGTLPLEVRAKVEGVEGIDFAEIDLVWDPPWSPAMLSEAAKLQLGF